MTPAAYGDPDVRHRRRVHGGCGSPTTTGAVNIVTETVNIANRPPTAEFTATPCPARSAGPTAAAASTDPDGSVVAYAWDTDADGVFDDGNTATVQPSYPATAPLRSPAASDRRQRRHGDRSEGGHDPEPRSGRQLRPGPAAPLTMEAVTFTSSSADADGAISAYAWDLDDDGAFDDANTQSAQRSFDDNGSYTVKLRVTDDDGGTAEISKAVTVANRPPAATFSHQPADREPVRHVTFTSSLDRLRRLDRTRPRGTSTATASSTRHGPVQRRSRSRRRATTVSCG